MATLSMYSMTESDLTAFANQVKESLVATLESDGLIEKDAALRYAIVVVRKNWLGQLMEKIFTHSGEDGMRIRIVKVVG